MIIKCPGCQSTLEPKSKIYTCDSCPKVKFKKHADLPYFRFEEDYGWSLTLNDIRICHYIEQSYYWLSSEVSHIEMDFPFDLYQKTESDILLFIKTATIFK
jgi:hypothetical protein